jgi:hypothetical protein
MDVYLIGIHLKGVSLIDVQVIGVHLIDVYYGVKFDK